MRTMVALVFAFSLLKPATGLGQNAGQARPAAVRPPQRPNANNAPIEVLEKFVAQNPDDVPTRIAILQRYFSAPEGAIPPALIRQERRRQILWMIAHHPDAGEMSRPIAVIDPKGRFADPQGYAEASKLWYSRAAVPSASPKTIANAIFFFRFNDPAAAHELLEYGLKANPKNNDLARMQGMLDAIAFIAAKDADFNGNVTAVDVGAAKSPAAVKARERIESTTSAALAGSAGQFLAQQSGFLTREFVFGDQDPLELAKRWLLHARQLDPKNEAWIDGLMQVYLRSAGQSLDPHAKEQYLAKALEIADTQPRQMRVLTDSMEAEFDAGNAAAAGRDAQQLLDIVTVNPTVGNFDQIVHVAETMLGRVALADGNRKEAVQHLMESAKVKLTGAPKLTLAQDLLDAGERDAVIQYLEACRAFWKFDEGRIDHAEALIRTQTKPDILLTPRPAGISLVKKKAPAFDLTDLSGKQWSLEEIGAKPVALVFWKASCVACRDQLQMLQHAPGPLVVLAVNIGDDAKHVEAYLAKNQIELPVLMDGGDVARKYNADQLPTLVTIDPRGDVAAYIAGNFPPEALRAQIVRGFGRELSAPLPLPPSGDEHSACTSLQLAWRAAPGAESYVVQWDTPAENGWTSEREDGFLPVVATSETKTLIECPREGCKIRWRVYGVSARDGSGPASQWREAACQ